MTHEYMTFSNTNPKATMKKYLQLSVLCLTLMGLSACGEGEKSAEQAPVTPQAQSSQQQEKPKTPVVGMVVKTQSIEQSNQLPGRVKAYRMAEIRPQVSGIIESRLFEEGSLVTKGQQLYQIDPARYEAEYESAQANLETAQAKYKSTLALSDRYENLVKKQAVSKQQYDDAVSETAQAKATVAQAEAALKTAKINLDYTKVYAPINGYISPSSVTEGALVTAQQETALATIRQLDPVYVDLSQSSNDTASLQARLTKERMENDVQKNYAVTLYVNGDEPYPVTGVLDATDLSVNEDTGTIRLRAVFPNRDTALLPGMFVQASVESVGSQQAIIVPQKAVKIEPNGGKSVFVIADGDVLSKRMVETDGSYQNNWIIKSGLKEGERIAIEGIMMVGDGMPVAVTMTDEDKAETKTETKQKQPQSNEGETK